MGVYAIPSDLSLDDLIRAAQADPADTSAAMAEILDRFAPAITATANSVTTEWNSRQDAAQGAPPILVIGTTNDPATPYVWAQSLASELSSGVLLTHVGEGHGVYGLGNQCATNAVDDYLLDGTTPAVGTQC